MKTWKFDEFDFELSEETLPQQNRKQLMNIYNVLAVKAGKSQLGIASTHGMAVDRVLGLLESSYGEQKPAKKPGQRAPSTVTNAAKARPIKRLVRSHLARIKKIKAPDENQRLKFWDKYKDGMTMREVIETNGLDDTQVRYWVRLGCVELVQEDEDEYRRQKDLFDNATS